MKCFRYFSFALFALLGVFFGSFIINQNNTYAIDYTSCPVSVPSNTTLSTVTFRKTNSCTNYSLTNSSQSPNKYILTIVFKDSGGHSFPLEVNTQYNSPNTYSFNSFAFSIGPVFVGSNYYFKPGVSYEFVFYDSLVDNGSPYRYSHIYTNWSYVESANIRIYPPDSGLTPSGSLEITENGTYDVTNYAEAVVNIPETDCPPSSGGDYHNDLVAINNSIIICAATCLVIYFFYCIYRMIIKNSGVK